MGYARQVYLQAENELNRRRTTAQDTAQRRLEDFYAVCPEAEDVRRRIASTASQAAMAVLRSGNARETMEALKNENLSLQKQFADLLAAHGLTRADIEPQYTCKRCEDTGYVDGRICSCYRNLLKQIAYENLNRICICCIMCPIMSLIATMLFKDTHTFGTFIQTWGMNFPCAVLWQMFYCGPLVRLIFRLIFREKKSK